MWMHSLHQHRELPVALDDLDAEAPIAGIGPNLLDHDGLADMVVLPVA